MGIEPTFEHWSNQCRGKVKYKTRRAALTARSELVDANQARTPSRLNEYRCSVCRSWHLGNTPSNMFPPPLKRMRAVQGDVVEITWRDLEGREIVKTRHECPKEK